jgi:RHS repeat-associated protein
MATTEHISCGSPELVGDPVNVVTGANLSSTLDFRLIGPLTFEWFRHYDSAKHQVRFSLGWGCSHEYDRRLEFDADGMRYVGPLGRVVVFPPLASDGEEASSQGLRLLRVNALSYRVIDTAAITMVFQFRDAYRPALISALTRGPAQIQFQYDDHDRLALMIDSAGRVILVTCDAAGRIVRLTLADDRGRPSRNLVAYDYDTSGNISRGIDSYGHTFAFQYDRHNRLLTRADQSGYSFRFEYASDGRCIRSAGEDGLNEVRLRYLPNERVTVVTRADGGEWRYFYDENGSISRIVDPYGGARIFNPDADGRIVEELDANGNATQILHSASGGPVAKKTPLGFIIPLPEDPNAAEPGTERMARCAAEWEFGLFLDYETIALPAAGSASVAEFPAAVRNAVATRGPDADQSLSTSPFDIAPLGPIWWPVPRRGRVFSDLGKLIQQHGPDGARRRWLYDVNGNVQAYVDFDGSKHEYQRTSWDLLARESNPLGALTSYQWTRTQQIAAVVDPNGTRHEYTYDLKDRLVSIQRHGVTKERYCYDAADNLVQKLDSSNGPLLTLEVGPGNVVTKKTLGSGEVHTFGYDKDGRYLTISSDDCSIEFAYDKKGRRILEHRDGKGTSRVFSNDNRLTVTNVFEHFQISHHRTSESDLHIIDPTGTSQQVHLIGNGLVSTKVSNGSEAYSQYDYMGRCLLKVVSSRRNNSSPWTRRYSYSGEGRLLRVEDSRLGSTSYQYDAAHRLIGAFGPNGVQQTFVYDLAGNLMQQTGLTGVVLLEGNRLAQANGYRFEFNDRNHVAARVRDDQATHYFYDSRGLLTQCKTGGLDWRAQYDPLARRVRKTVNGQTTEFYWEGDRLTAEVAPDGRLRIYVYADPLSLVPFMFVDYESGDADPKSGRRFFIFTDQLGAPVLVENDLGQPVWEATLSAYGRANVSPGASIDMALRFPGHYFDAETGLHYNRYRYYSPELGRYLQSDPIGISGGLNLYAYPANPLARVDVLGFCPECDEKAKAKEDKEDNKRVKDDINAAEDLGIIAKPPNAPNYENWIAKGGSVQLSHDGTITYIRADGTAVPYRNGYPDFSDHMNHPSGVTQVNITQSTDRKADFAAANAAAGHPEWGNQPPPNYTWHHHENGSTMQLVPRDVHGDFTHAGGVSTVKNQGST